MHCGTPWIRGCGRSGILVGVLLLALAPAGGSAQEQLFRINNTAEPESLDPGIVTGVPEHRILSNLFEGLTGDGLRDALDPQVTARR